MPIPLETSASLGIAALVGTATAFTQQPVVTEMGALNHLIASPVGSAGIAGLVAVVTIRTTVRISIPLTP